MIVSTAGRTNDEMVRLAKNVAAELSVPYIQRNKQSIHKLQEQAEDDILVVGKNRIEIHPRQGAEPLFFHPNSAMFRMKRIAKGEHDPFIQASGLANGNTILDCTLGLGSDSIVASFVVGKSGKVVSLEGNKYLYYLLKGGLKSWDTGYPLMNEAMARIDVEHVKYERFLTNCPTNSFDVVYFDPMFEETIEESEGIKGLRNFAIYSTLTPEAIEAAKRVAKQKVVLKDHWKSEQFERYGFTVLKRKTAKFHFGVIDVEGS
ncbi:class I SAM-dependent methyltransferase [Fredinandcohnia sp. QZ13]|uniref:class I SAM-dependent methyltransferase n=1 Tax=Fredinandcohnia sp. QZ13 TaxID=3073144 RepID=UPI0028531EA5|nr:class I SAM-dependent methyltransferase [Fredinandcohnia sp. QZ13]MDR4888613.1 class I SAM-dependent methyltransferase [Fredinandcohnia sp. QZ13]